jgi:hypothetical protein
MSDELIPSSLDPDAVAELGESDAELTPDEHQGLTELATLLTVAARFELSPEARRQGLTALDVALESRAGRAQRRPIVSWWWSVAALAAISLAWLLPLSPERAPALPTAPALLEAQNAHLTSRLTGAALPRDDLERAQTEYRQELLAKLEGKR